MLDFTFLTEEQIFGDNKLEIFDKRGTEATVTDFAILLGAAFCDPEFHINNTNPSLTNKTGRYWTKSYCEGDDVSTVHVDGDWGSELVTDRYIGARPVFPYFLIKGNCFEKRANDGILEIKYGEYPQKAVSKKMQKELNRAIKRNKIQISVDKSYRVDTTKSHDFNQEFVPLTLNEYEYQGRKFVKVQCNSCYKKDIKIGLSNGEIYKVGDYVWVEVLPVKWLVDEKSNIAMSEEILFAGIQFQHNEFYDGNFENTDVKKYMDEYFSNEIISLSKIIKTVDVKSNKIKELKDAYEFDFEKVSEEDIIRGSIESNIAPFLHGRSSEGKSARIKQFDPNAEIVYLRNATPDSLNGKSVYNAEKNEMIDVPPTWYVKLKEKCEKEPDKLHIVFFDELTNALPSIQGMAFNIILDKEINGKWKLPENARVAAAGNDLEDSLAANTMAEPLFNRFNHVYINTTVESWLNWALTPNDSYERLDYKKEDNSKKLKIHPAIYAYIACKKDRVLRTPYTGVKPNADPRKWEMASKVLYQTNNPYMLRGLIGETLTNDFVAFCQTKVITIQDIINGNYDEKIFEINSSEKYLTTLALSSVDEENLEVVRNFIEKLGKDFLALFDSLWTIGDDKRLETLMNLKQGRVKIKK